MSVLNKKQEIPNATLDLLNLPSSFACLCKHMCAHSVPGGAQINHPFLSLLISLDSIFAGPPTLWDFLMSRFVPVTAVTFP